MKLIIGIVVIAFVMLAFAGCATINLIKEDHGPYEADPDHDDDSGL